MTLRRNLYFEKLLRYELSKIFHKTTAISIFHISPFTNGLEIEKRSERSEFSFRSTWPSKFHHDQILDHRTRILGHSQNKWITFSSSASHKEQTVFNPVILLARNDLAGRIFKPNFYKNSLILIGTQTCQIHFHGPERFLC